MRVPYNTGGVMRKTIPIYIIFLLVLIFSKPVNAELDILSLDYVPYAYPDTGFKSYWLVYGKVTPVWNEILITKSNFVDTEDGVTVNKEGEITAVVNNVVCEIPLSTSEYDILYYYGVSVFDEGYYFDTTKAYSECLSKLGKPIVWAGFYQESLKAYLVCVYKDSYLAKMYKPLDGKYKYTINFDYSIPGYSSSSLSLKVPDRKSIRDGNFEIIDEGYNLISGYNDYCDYSYLVNNFAFAVNKLNTRIFTRLPSYNTYKDKESNLVNDINYRSDAEVYTYDSVGRPVYKITSDGYVGVTSAVASLNGYLDNMWIEDYTINTNTKIIMGGELIKYTTSPIEAKVKLIIDKGWLGIKRLLPQPVINDVIPKSFDINSQQSKDVKISISNKGSEGNVIIKLGTGCSLLDMDYMSIHMLEGETKEVTANIRAKGVTSQTKVNCEIKVCDPSEQSCDSRTLYVTILPGCTNECTPGTPPYCDGNYVVTCSLSPNGCYTISKQYCENGCENGKCKEQVVAVCGNGICEVGETYDTCPSDCKTIVCGNGVCEYGENEDTCPIDCRVQPECKWWDIQCHISKLIEEIKYIAKNILLAILIVIALILLIRIIVIRLIRKVLYA